MVEINPINLMIAFLAGILTFFAGCVAPIVPVYLGYLSGTSLENLKVSQGARSKAFFNGLFFVTGFMSVFMVLGLSANSLARILNPHRNYIELIGGIVVVILGLYFLNILKIPFLSKERSLSFGKIRAGKPISGLILGLIFGFAWTPCIGPVLATILLISALGQDTLSALTLMEVFSLGLALPFLVIALLFDKIAPKLTKFYQYLPIFQKITGILIIIIGILLVTGHYTYLSRYLLDLFGSSAFVLEFR